MFWFMLMCASAGSNRTDLRKPLVVILADVKHWLARDHVPPQERLGTCIDLIVMSSIGEGGTFLDEVVHPRSVQGMGK